VVELCPARKNLMSTIKQNIQVSPQDVFTSSATQGTDLGAMGSTGDGRYFRYVLNGGVTMVPGKVYQGPAEDATNQSPAGGLAMAAAAIGATSITTTSTVTLAANLLAGGYASIVAGTGLGYTYKIKGNTAAAGAVVTFTLEDPIVVALTTSSKLVVHKSPYDGVVVAPATLTAAPIGVSVAPITNAQYGWVQSRGPVSCLVTGTFATAGLAVGVLVGGTIGSLAPCIAGTPVLGYTCGISATTEYDLVFLTID
jgi:hypothetical protein